MQPRKAVVKNGRLLLDEPSDLPEGQVVLLVPLEELMSLVEDGGDDDEVAFTFVAPPQRVWRQPKPVDAAALIEELRSR